MTRLWFCTITRKFLSAFQAQPTTRPARPGVRLHLEGLEERAVTSAASAGPVAVEPPRACACAIIYGEHESPTGESGHADHCEHEPQAGPDDLVFERLLEALRHPEALRVATFNGGAPTAPSPGVLGIPPPPTPAVGPQAFGPDGAASKPGQPASLPQPGTPPAPSVPGRNDGSAAEGAAQARPPASPGARGAAAPASAPGTVPPHAGPAVAREQSLPAAPGTASSRHDSRAAQAGVAPRPAGASEAAATRTEARALLADLPDGSLLQRFVAGREQAAFSTLVQRHERLVLRVCRRVLGDPHAADDAFQLTFLVLARKAGTLDPRHPLTGWLYKVAYRVALRLRGTSAQQRRTEERAADGRTSPDGDFTADLERREMRQALREELDRLPEKYRAPLVLCYFDGRTHDEAARAIGLPRGSMAKRLAEGLQRIRERLLVRGFVP